MYQPFGMRPFAGGLPDPDRQPDFYADVPVKRLVAWALDSVLTLGLCLLALPFTAFAGLLVWPMFWLTIGFFYRLATVAAFSATPGMMVMAIGLRDARGERLSRQQAFWHCLTFTVATAMILPQLASMTMMLTTARRQGLGDLALGTAMLNRAAAV